MAVADMVDLDRRAVLLSVDQVARVGRGDLGRPTPCTDWDLAALLAHMTVQHHGFAAAARGAGVDADVWTPGPLTTEPLAAYRTAADDVLAAFAEPVAALWLPEISTARPVPAAQAVSFHFVDYLVHSWDVARALMARQTDFYGAHAADRRPDG